MWVKMCLYSVVLCILGVISVTDYRTGKIPDTWNFLLFLLGVCSSFLMRDVSFSSRLIAVFCVSLPLLLAAVFSGGAIGGGDIKLMAASGMLLGMNGNFLAAFCGFALAGCYGFFLLCSGKAGRKDSFAMGPFLCAGIAISLLRL